jgi:hypothetical protein
METAVVRLSMPGGVGGQRCEPLPTRLTMGETHGHDNEHALPFSLTKEKNINKL